MSYVTDTDRMGTRGPKRAEDRTERRDFVVGPFRVTEEERDAIEAGAKADGQTVGVWLRELGLKRRRAQERKK